MRMPGVLTLAATIAVWSVIEPVAAQTHPPSDNQLLAGYCLGVTNAEKAMEEKNFAEEQGWPSLGPEWSQRSVEAYQRALASLERNRQRFLGYILSDTTLDWTGIIIATRNGETDLNEGLRKAERNCKRSPPSLREYQDNGRAWFEAEIERRSKQYQECGDKIPEIQRFKRCSMPNILPF